MKLPAKLTEFEDRFDLLNEPFDKPVLEELRQVCESAIAVGHEWVMQCAIDSVPIYGLHTRIFYHLDTERINQFLSACLTDKEWLAFYYYIEDKLDLIEDKTDEQ
jgi:hypothetical protein